MNYRDEYRQSIDAKEDFWEEKSKDLPWIKKPTEMLTVGADGLCRFGSYGQRAALIIRAPERGRTGDRGLFVSVYFL